LIPQGLRLPATFAANTPQELAALKVPDRSDPDSFRDVHEWSHVKGKWYSHIQAFHLKYLTRLCNQLDAYTENGGSMLDNTLIYVSGEVGDKGHEHTNIPCLILGGCGGYFGKMGRYITVDSQRRLSNPQFSTSRVLLSIAHACGLKDLNSIGMPEYCPGPLPKLRV
jgi:hypothetical protein